MSKYNIAGIGFCVLIALPAWFLGKLFPVIGGPVFGIMLGMVLHVLIKKKTGLQPGITYTSKKILQYAVVLLGFGMNLSEVVMRGKQSLPLVISTISTALLVAYILSKILKVPSKTAILVGVGSSICGGSAIAATAPVILADDEEVAQSISVIFLFNIIAALLFPLLGEAFAMDNVEFGFFAGSAINDTSSVTAAAAVWDGIYGGNALDIATVVKLTRTVAIIPITLILSVSMAHKEKNSNKNRGIINSFPLFIIYFLVASVITTVFSLAPEVTQIPKMISKFFIVMAMIAIGFNTNVINLIKKGGKPILLGGVCWGCIIAVSLLVITISF